MRELDFRYAFHGTTKVAASFIARDGLCLRPAALINGPGYYWVATPTVIRNLTADGEAPVLWGKEVISWYRNLPERSRAEFKAATGPWKTKDELGRRIALLWVTTDFQVAADFSSGAKDDGKVLVLDLSKIARFGVIRDRHAQSEPGSGLASYALVLPPDCWQSPPDVVADVLDVDWKQLSRWGQMIAFTTTRNVMPGVWRKDADGVPRLEQ